MKDTDFRERKTKNAVLLNFCAKDWNTLAGG